MATLLKIKGPQGSGKSMFGGWIEVGLKANGLRVVRYEGEHPFRPDLSDAHASHADANVLIVEEQTSEPGVVFEWSERRPDGAWHVLRRDVAEAPASTLDQGAAHG